MIFGTGCYPEPQTKSHYQLDHVAMASFKPFDWSKGFDIEQKLGLLLPVKDQGSRKSCVGEALATYSYVHNALELAPIYERDLSAILPELSAKSLYSQIALESGGAFIGDGLKLISTFGVSRESDVPSYDEYRQPLTEAQVKDLSWLNGTTSNNAKNYISKEYRFIYDRGSVDLIAQTIEECGGCVVGLFIDDADSWLTEFPSVGSRRMYSHGVYLGKARLINGKRYFGLLNSWGKGVGRYGWQWIPAEYFQSGMVHTVGAMTDQYNSTWVKFFDKNGKPRAFPTYMLKSIKYMLERGSKLAMYYD